MLSCRRPGRRRRRPPTSDRPEPRSRTAPIALTFTALSLAVVVACALAWSGFDLSRKALVERIAPTPLLLLLTAGQAPAFAAWAALDGWPGIGAGYWAPALGSVALNVVANLAFLHAFQRAPISMTIPLLSLTPALTALFAVPLLGELPGPRHGAGIALVVAGAFLLNLAPGQRGDVVALLRAFARHPGSRLMLLVAICWSATPPLDKLALARASVPVHGLVLTTGVALAVLVVLVAQGRAGELRTVGRSPGLFLLSLATSCVALGLQLVAVRLVWVALVETLKRGLGNVLALVYGRFIFREAVGAAKVVAVALMGAGVALLLV